MQPAGIQHNRLVDGVGTEAGVARHVAEAMLRAEAETSVVYPPGRWVVALRRLLQGTALLLVLAAVFSYLGGAVPAPLVVAVVVIVFVLLVGALAWHRGVRAEPVWPQRGRSVGVLAAVGGLVLVGVALVLGPTVLRSSIAPVHLEVAVLCVGTLLVVLFAAEPLRWSRPPGGRTCSWPAGAEEYAVLSTAAMATYIDTDWLLDCAGLPPMAGGLVVDRLVADGRLRAGHGSRGAVRVVRLLPSGRQRHREQRAGLLAAAGAPVAPCRPRGHL